MPIVYNRYKELMCRRYCDGAIGLGQPINFMVQGLGCTDIIVVCHRSLEEKPHDQDWLAKCVESLMMKLYMRGSSEKLKEAFLSYRSRSDKLVGDILSGVYSPSEANIALLFMPEHNVNRFSTNSNELRFLAEQGRQQIKQVFGKLDI